MACVYLRNLKVWHSKCSDSPRHLCLVVTQPLAAQGMLNVQMPSALIITSEDSLKSLAMVSLLWHVSFNFTCSWPPASNVHADISALSCWSKCRSAIVVLP